MSILINNTIRTIKCCFTFKHSLPSTDFPEAIEITQISFEGDVISASMGLWLYNNNVNMTSEGCLTDSCGLFTSADESKLELAYFSNAFDRFESFSVSLFFKRSSGVAGTQSLLDNSECDVDGSVVATSSSGVVDAYFANSTGAVADLLGMVSIRHLGQYVNMIRKSRCIGIIH